MKIYFEAQEDDRPCKPPMAIDVAKALIVYAQDMHDKGPEYMAEHGDWLDQIREHLHAYTRSVNGAIIRERRQNVD